MRNYKINFLSLILVLVMTIMLPMQSSAAVRIDHASCEGGIFTVRGGTDTKGELVLLRAFKSDGTSYDTAADIINYLFYAEDKLTDANKEFSFSFGINNGATGNYRIILTSADGVSSDARTILGINEASILKTIAEINSAADSGDIKTAFELNNAAENITLDISVFSRLTDDGEYSKGLVYSELYKQKEKLPLSYIAGSGIYSGKDEFQAVLDLYSRLAHLNESKNTYLLDSYDSYFEVDSSAVAVSLSEKLANSAAVIAASKTDTAKCGGYKSLEDMRLEFSKNMILNAIELNDRFMVKTIVKADGVSAVLGADFKLSDYLKMTDTSNVDTAVAKKSFANIADFKKAFNDAVDGKITDTKPPVPGNPAGGSLGGGSGSGGGGGIGAELPGGGNITVEDASSGELPPFTDTSFNDISSHEWAREAIEYLQDINVINGTAPNTFSPEQTVKREEFVKMLVILAGAYKENAKTDFSDIPSSHWSESYIASAHSAGLVQGIADGIFGIGNEISRQDACVLLSRVVGDMVSIGEAKDFSDKANIASYAVEAIDKMSALGIINGMEDGSFRPNDSMTRAQAAKVLYELYRKGGFENEK